MTSTENISKFRFGVFIIKYFKVIAFILAIIAIAASFFLWIRPARNQTVIARKALQSLKEQIENKRSSVANLQMQAKNIVIIKKLRTETLSEILSSEESKEDLHIILKEILEEEGLLVTKLSIGLPIPFGSYVALGGPKTITVDPSLPIVVVSVSADVVDTRGNLGYGRIKDILRGLNLKRRILAIRTLKIGATSDILDKTVRESREATLQLSFDTFLLTKKEVE